jgi:hypothetical protein
MFVCVRRLRAKLRELADSDFMPVLFHPIPFNKYNKVNPISTT